MPTFGSISLVPYTILVTSRARPASIKQVTTRASRCKLNTTYTPLASTQCLSSQRHLLLLLLLLFTALTSPSLSLITFFLLDFLFPIIHNLLFSFPA